MDARAKVNLILMGLRGSGKTTVGRMVADRLGREVVDVDRLTLKVLGMTSAAQAFATIGEPSFRVAEVMALADALAEDGRVVALGGGTPTAPGAAEILEEEAGAERAWIVYLHASPAALKARLSGDDLSNRPALLGADPVAEVDQVYGARDGLYRRLASVVIEVGDVSASEAAERVVRAFEALG